jgi:ribosomal protein S18 acetylase RimI-like enzyme
MDLNLDHPGLMRSGLMARWAETATHLAEGPVRQEPVWLRSNYGEATQGIDVITAALAELIIRLEDRYLVTTPPKRLMQRKAMSVIQASVEDGKLWAWAGLYIIPLERRRFYIGGVAVHEDCRGRNLAAQMLAREMLRIEELYGPDASFDLHVRVYDGEANPKGVRTFAKVGFELRGPEQVELYTGEVVETVKMETSPDWSTRARVAAYGMEG